MLSLSRISLCSFATLVLASPWASAEIVGYQLQLSPAYQLERFELPNVQSSALVGQPAAENLYAFAHDPVSDELLAATFDGALGRLDPDTAEWSPIVLLSGAIGSITGLATLGGTEPLYVSSTDGSSSSLFDVDRATGTSTLIGSFGGRVYVDIAIDAAGRLFAHCILTDSIYRLSAGGSETLVGPTGIDASYSQGMDFDRSTGELYAWIYTSSTGSTHFSRIDTSTGAATLLQLLPGEFEGVLTAPLPRIFADGFEAAP